MTAETPWQERMRLIRWRRAHERPRFRDEIRIIPRAVFYTVAALFVIALIVAQIINVRDPFAPQVGVAWSGLALAGVVTAIAIPTACLIFLIAYVNRDAKRREMSPVLWTLIAALLPYLIGVFAYFLLREPLPAQCPRCGAVVNARFHFCPKCRANLLPACPYCKREVDAKDRYCPYCAGELTAATTPATAPEEPRTA